MDTIGNAADAQLILEWVRDSRVHYGKPDVVSDEQAPEGWKYVSYGSFRSVWASPEGVAYKVTHTTHSSQSNSEEYDNLVAVRDCKLPMSARLPKAELFELQYGAEDEEVIAMELIHGVILLRYRGPRESEYYEILRICEIKLELSDLHDENVVIDEITGDLVVVDLGC